MNLVEQLDRLSHPLSQSAIVACFGLLCLCWRRYRVGVASIALAMLWLGLCSTPVFATWLQRGLKNQYPPRPATSYPKTDAIVILGGGDLPGPDINWHTDSLDVRATRVGFGLQLYRHERAHIVLLSGGDGEATRMTAALAQQGVDADALRTEQASTTTHENALYSASILKHEKLHSILLVTSAMHMPRAVASFRQVGLAVVAAPALDPKHQPEKARRPWWPDRGALNLSNRCLREYLGLWSYKLLGWA